MAAQILVQASQLVHELSSPRTIIGRAPDCGVVLLGRPVSRQHAAVVRFQGAYWLEDLGSRNGTRLNDRDVKQRIELHDQDKIKICDHILVFCDGRDTPSGIRHDGSTTDGA